MGDQENVEPRQEGGLSRCRPLQTDLLKTGGGKQNRPRHQPGQQRGLPAGLVLIQTRGFEQKGQRDQGQRPQGKPQAVEGEGANMVKG